MPQAHSDTTIDNELVKVTTWSFEPGQATGRHRHEHDYVVVPLTDGDMRIDSAAEQSHNDLRKGRCYFRRAGVEHDVSNPGTTPLVFVEIEIKLPNQPK